MKKEKTQAIKLNKDLSIDFSEYKRKITTAENGRYSYFDFSKEAVSEIASKEIDNVSVPELRMLAQALFPEYLQCSGLFDGFLFFEIRSNKRVDPPKYYYCFLSSYLNNDNKAKVNRLSEEVKDLFEQNGISYSESWKQFFDGIYAKARGGE